MIIGTLRYTTARCYYGYHDRKDLGESTSRQSAKFSAISKTKYKGAQSKEWKVTFIQFLTAEWLRLKKDCYCLLW